MNMFGNQNNMKSDMCVVHKAAICIVIVLLVYNYYHTKPSIVVYLPEPTFSLLTPYNESRPAIDDVYDQLIGLRNFSFLVNPQPCKEYKDGLLMVVIVSSNPINFENRRAIRSTWGKNTDSTKLVFLIGTTANRNISHNIQEEIIKYNDIVLGNFVDAYRNMTYKHVMGLKWVSHHCPTAKYILKTDDDVLVNMDGLRHFLARELSPWGATNLISCNLLTYAPVQRDRYSKWKVSKYEYSSSYYPAYCTGWAILYSQDVVPKLLKAAQSERYFWIDDVQITGVIAEKIGVNRTQLSKLILSKYRAHLLTVFGPNYSGPFIFGPPDLSVHRILQIWNAMMHE